MTQHTQPVVVAQHQQQQQQQPPTPQQQQQTLNTNNNNNTTSTNSNSSSINNQTQTLAVQQHNNNNNYQQQQQLQQQHNVAAYNSQLHSSNLYVPSHGMPPTHPHHPHSHHAHHQPGAAMYPTMIPAQIPSNVYVNNVTANVNLHGWTPTVPHGAWVHSGGTPQYIHGESEQGVPVIQQMGSMPVTLPPGNALSGNLMNQNPGGGSRGSRRGRGGRGGSSASRRNDYNMHRHTQSEGSPGPQQSVQTNQQDMLQQQQQHHHQQGLQSSDTQQMLASMPPTYVQHPQYATHAPQYPYGYPTYFAPQQHMIHPSQSAAAQQATGAPLYISTMPVYNGPPMYNYGYFMPPVMNPNEYQYMSGDEVGPDGDDRQSSIEDAGPMMWHQQQMYAEEYSMNPGDMHSLSADDMNQNPSSMGSAADTPGMLSPNYGPIYDPHLHEQMQQQMGVMHLYDDPHMGQMQVMHPQPGLPQMEDDISECGSQPSGAIQIVSPGAIIAAPTITMPAATEQMIHQHPPHLIPVVTGGAILPIEPTITPTTNSQHLHQHQQQQLSGDSIIECVAQNYEPVAGIMQPGESITSLNEQENLQESTDNLALDYQQVQYQQQPQPQPHQPQNVFVETMVQTENYSTSSGGSDSCNSNSNNKILMTDVQELQENVPNVAVAIETKTINVGADNQPQQQQQQPIYQETQQQIVVPQQKINQIVPQQQMQQQQQIPQQQAIIIQQPPPQLPIVPQQQQQQPQQQPQQQLQQQPQQQYQSLAQQQPSSHYSNQQQHQQHSSSYESRKSTQIYREQQQHPHQQQQQSRRKYDSYHSHGSNSSSGNNNDTTGSNQQHQQQQQPQQPTTKTMSWTNSSQHKKSTNTVAVTATPNSSHAGGNYNKQSSSSTNSGGSSSSHGHTTRTYTNQQHHNYQQQQQNYHYQQPQTRNYGAMKMPSSPISSAPTNTERKISQSSDTASTKIQAHHQQPGQSTTSTASTTAAPHQFATQQSSSNDSVPTPTEAKPTSSKQYPSGFAYKKPSNTAVTSTAIVASSPSTTNVAEAATTPAINLAPPASTATPAAPSTPSWASLFAGNVSASAALTGGGPTATAAVAASSASATPQNVLSSSTSTSTNYSKKPIAKVAPYEGITPVTPTVPLVTPGNMSYSAASAQNLPTPSQLAAAVPPATGNKRNSADLQLQSQRNSNLDEFSQKFADFLTKYKSDWTTISLRPRGLTNRSNYCYINSILQALLGCSPLHNLIRSIPKQAANLCEVKTPTINAMITFMSNFSNLPSGLRLRNTKPGKGANKDDLGGDLQCDPAFEPTEIYKLWNDSREEHVEGRQEDAEEFLSYILNKLNDEMLEVIKLIAKPSPAQNGQTEQLEEEGDVWQICNNRNKGSVTRQTDFGCTPLSDIFRGELRSRLQREGEHSTDVIQPFFTLQLNIEKSASVKEALEILVGRDQLEGVTGSKTKQEVVAWQQMNLEKLPPILILHLKWFDYRSDGCTKIIKKVEFPVELKIDAKILASKKYSQKQRAYRLFAVVYHDGKEATKGHYITDVYHTGYGSWLRYDDSSVKPVSENHVLLPRTPRVPYLLCYRRCDTITQQQANTSSSHNNQGNSSTGNSNSSGNTPSSGK